MRPRLLVVLGELAQQVLQMPAAEDQYVIEDLAPDRPNPPLAKALETAFDCHRLARFGTIPGRPPFLSASWPGVRVAGLRPYLTFEHWKLVAEGENLSAEPGVWPAVDDEDLEQEPDDSVGKGEDHDEGGSQRPARRAVYAPNELTQVG